MARRSRGAGRLHGFLIIDKPAGWTSHDVVARVRRLTGEARVGHAGTLDPAATGVLPVAVGDATRVLEYLSEASKTYLADVTFGVETDSADVDGNVVSIGDPSPLAEETVREAVARFRGEIDQIPPMHSAIKIDGRRLYELARQGKEIERPVRRVTIYENELIDFSNPVATIVVDCSKGTYIRSLAHDIGRALGVGAYLSNLVRLRAGPFDVCEAWTLAALAEADLAAEWESIAIHPDAVLSDWPAIILDGEELARWHRGQSIATESRTDAMIRVLSNSGEWVGVGQSFAEMGSMQPVKVTASAA